MINLEIIKSRIYSLEKLKNEIARWRFFNKTIVFTNGCFDLLHLGHIDYLSKAADQGDILVIGLNSDISVRKIKGNKRPVLNEEARSVILASLRFVNSVVLFDEETPYDLINFIQPDILIKGSDYKPDDIVGADIVLGRGGRVITIDFLQGYSSSEIINKIIDLNKS